ncbi:hypothetical protein SAMN05518672_103526 [Chitinophaga sp. CF118]|uniref:DUF6265 family protein n=1 Tax=Chitinophaga sp. CF118 TaxID=1884367 RepID=UPI0008F1D667|nr:DUF6265 family protein [Chitinophaga sp. CF118]SFD85424.1 hypothetical protein SAMN05518672_103526 [Chitinophaga sp. CF118]
MVRKLLYSSSLLIIFCLNAATAQVTNADFHYLDRMEGNWAMHTKRSTFREIWTRINADSWQGISWRIVGNDSVKQDEMKVLRTSEGIFYTIAAVTDPQNGQPIRFKLRVLKTIGFVAENTGSNYPQKITYRWKDDKHMDAHFEGKQEKTFSEIILQYVKE